MGVGSIKISEFLAICQREACKIPGLVRHFRYGLRMSYLSALLCQQCVQMANSEISEVFQVLDRLTKAELVEMVSGQLSVPHAERTKQKLVRFVIENGSEELLQNLKDRAQRKLGKRKERSTEDLEVASHKRVCFTKSR